MLRYTVFTGEVNGDRTPVARYASQAAALLAARRIHDAGQPAFIRDGNDVVFTPDIVPVMTADLERLELDAATEYLHLVVAQVRELLDAVLHEDEQLARAADAVTFDRGISSMIHRRRRTEANDILRKLVLFNPVLAEDLTVEQTAAAD